jgi:hypothetical protein
MTADSFVHCMQPKLPHPLWILTWFWRLIIPLQQYFCSRRFYGGGGGMLVDHQPHLPSNSTRQKTYGMVSVELWTRHVIIHRRNQGFLASARSLRRHQSTKSWIIISWSKFTFCRPNGGFLLMVVGSTGRCRTLHHPEVYVSSKFLPFPRNVLWWYWYWLR